MYICTTLSQYEYIEKPLEPIKVANLLEEDVRKCCQVLGIKFYRNLGYEDGFYTYSSETVKEMVEILREYKPTIVFTRWPYESHPDHRNTAKVVRRAIILANYKYYRSGREFPETANVRGLYYTTGGNQPWLYGFEPNIYVSVEKHVKGIVEAYLSFKTVKGIKEGLRRGLIIRAYNGVASGFKLAEAIQKDIKFSGWKNDPLLEIAKEYSIPVKA